MSDLQALIRQSNIRKRQLLPTTVRIPEEMRSFIEELAEHLSLSKQETLLKLIEEGVKIAKMELKLDEFDPEENDSGNTFYLLNTNRSNDVTDQDDMLENQIAAAYYGQWKKLIDRINKGDIVFLYENGVGIIAYGTGSGETKIKDKNGDVGECHYQNLSDFHKLENPISASDIKRTLNRNVVFLKTMISVADGQRILDRIQGN